MTLKKRKDNKKKWVIGLSIFLVWLVLAIVNTDYERGLRPKPVDIFEVGESVVLGDATLQGVLRFDPSIDPSMSYQLVLTDGRILVVDSSSKLFNKDLVDQEVTITGSVVPLPNDSFSGLIILTTIKQS
ncbi:hypothetical protein KBD69_00505 [Candidatus Woesebacteria bacterium]|nr:hypothetical protein [Candidatus Woesebacteria bacterium]